MMRTIKAWLSGGTPEEVVKVREQEIRQLHHEFKNSIQAVQSGNRLLKSMSGAIALNRRSKPQ